MKRYKIFAVDENNMITFTKEELEEILDETYNDGFSDGKLVAQTTSIRNSTNDPSSTGNNPLNPYVTCQGPNGIPPSYSNGSSYVYSTATTTARNESNL